MALNEMDARLISQGAETTAIGSSALVSVAEGAGQPQMNIQLGNFADSMAKAVPQKTKDQVSITGLYAKTTDGKMVELTSESVASVVAGLINPIKQTHFKPCSWDILRDYGLSLPIGSSAWFTSSGFADSGLLSSKPEGIITYVRDAGVLRVFFATMEAREYTISTQTWGDIKTAQTSIFGYNSLEGLANGLKPLLGLS